MVNIFGYIVDLSGDPVKGASVTAVSLTSAAVNFPSYTVKTNASGYFSLNLTEGLEVDIYIPSINYRRTIEVPLTSQNLFGIP